MEELESKSLLIREGKIRVRQHVNKLPEVHKTSIVLRFWHNYSILEISEVLRLSWSQTDWIIDESLVMLKESMTNEKESVIELKIGRIA